LARSLLLHPNPEQLAWESVTLATVLVVDDETDLCLALRMYLEHLGHKVLLFHSAGDVRRKLDSNDLRAEYAFIDQQLGSCLGSDLAMTLADRMPSIRIVLMSGLPLEDEDIPDLPNVKLLFMQKPFRSAEVAAILRRLG
jgi:DNA-binding NtrC family response regulator